MWIESSDYDWEPMPVIGLSLGEIEAEIPDELKKGLTARLKKAAELEELVFHESDPSEAFEELIKSVPEKSGLKAAIVIDGYDGPMLARICYPNLAKELADTMADFLEALGEAEEWLGPALITDQALQRRGLQQAREPPGLDHG